MPRFAPRKLKRLDARPLRQYTFLQAPGGCLSIERAHVDRQPYTGFSRAVLETSLR